MPPDWRTNLPSTSVAACDRLAVGHLRLADVGFHAELALHAVDDDFQVQLAHAGDDGLAGFLVGAHAERRIFLAARRPRAMPIFSWSALVLGSTACEITGSGKTIFSSVMIDFRIAQRLAGGDVLQAHAGGDVAGADLLDLFTLVGVHLQDPADALLLARIGL